MNRALKLHSKHTRSELLVMARQVKDDPASREGARGLYIYNRKAMKFLEDIQWAIYWHHSPQGNSSLNRAPPDVKRW